MTTGQALFNRGIQDIVDFILHHSSKSEQVSVFKLVWEKEERSRALVDRVVQAVYDHPSLASSLFSRKARVRLSDKSDPYDLREELVQATVPQVGEQYDYTSSYLMRMHMRGQRFFILLEHFVDKDMLAFIISEFVSSDFRPGSVLVTTGDELGRDGNLYNDSCIHNGLGFQTPFQKTRIQLHNTSYDGLQPSKCYMQ
ncbi:hypothetical protein CFC21_044973 [Triticum aestivum]|uniref:Uncharacterized protein n=2 Tax=Triticum aestivum TaxID=4565 RepID=A0A9R1JY48_WHEAT|nr:hypothetical protein CFC21_044973 [Triticum aestivum]